MPAPAAKADIAAVAADEKVASEAPATAQLTKLITLAMTVTAAPAVRTCSALDTCDRCRVSRILISKRRSFHRSRACT